VTVLIYPGEFGIVYRGTLSGWRGKAQELIAVKAKRICMSAFTRIARNVLTRLSVVCGGDHTGSCYHYIRLQSDIRCQGAARPITFWGAPDFHVDVHCMSLQTAVMSTTYLCTFLAIQGSISDSTTGYGVYQIKLLCHLIVMMECSQRRQMWWMTHKFMDSYNVLILFFAI